MLHDHEESLDRLAFQWVPMPRFTADGLQTPQTPITKDDRLVIRAWNTVGGVILRIRARLLCPKGRIIPFDFQMKPAATRVATDASIALVEGWLLDVALIAVAGAPRRGQCFVQVGLLRGGSAFADIAVLLVSDYIAEGAALGWPGGLIRSSVEGPGIIRSILGTDPPPGAEIVETVPANARWRLHAFNFVLTTDATAVTRTPSFIIDDGTNILWSLTTEFFAGAGPSTSVRYNLAALAQGGGIAAVANPTWIPRFDLMQGWRMRTSTANLQPGDNYAAPRMMIEEWIED